MIDWLIYSLIVSTLVCLAALSVERALRLYRLPTRFVWTFALGLALLIPLAVHLTGPSRLLPAGFVTLPGIVVGAGEAIGGAAGGTTPSGTPGRGIAHALLPTWVALSSLLAIRAAVSFIRLKRARAGWRTREIDGTEVLVSEDVGPAVTGLLRSAIVIPEWVLELDSDRRDLVLAHEREHLRAGDHRLLALGLAICIVVPWNLPLWWALRRMRLAAELDCDRRVLARSGDPLRYGSLLLEVGQRGSMPGLAPAAFSEGARQLERRVRAMTAAIPRYRAGRAALAGVLALSLMALACETPEPSAGNRPAAPEGALKVSTDRQAKVTGVVVDAESGLPLGGVLVHLENTGIGAHTMENGRYFLLNVPPGRYHLRAEKMGYAPVRPEVELESGQTLEQSLELRRSSGEGGPVFTPFTVGPEIADIERAVESVVRHYPDSLQAAGIGGTVHVWAYINEAGVVEQTKVQRSSGIPALDRAALDAVKEFEYRPGKNRGRVVPVWLAIPITFNAEPD